MAGELVTAGAAFGPWGAAIGAVAEVGMAVAKTPPPPTGPTMSDLFANFDNSGWNVNFGSGSITSTDERKTGSAAGSGNEEWVTLAIVIAAGIVVMKLFKK